MPRVYNLVIKHLPGHHFPTSAAVDLGQLKSELEKALLDMLNHDFERLLQLMYLVDVPQQAFEEAMKEGSIKSIAARLAELLIHREWQKTRFRQ